MYKITNKKTGFFYYLKAHEVDMFFKKQDPYKYEVKEIKSFDFENLFAFIVFLILMGALSFSFMFFSF